MSERSTLGDVSPADVAEVTDKVKGDNGEIKCASSEITEEFRATRALLCVECQWLNELALIISTRIIRDNNLQSTQEHHEY